MKLKILLALAAAIVIGAGCVSTVNDRSTVGIPFTKDKFEGRYPRTVDQVMQASKDVIMANGALIQESISYSPTNQVKTVEGKVNQRNVWIRVEPVEPKVTSVIVQARTPAGGSDMDLVHDIEKQI